MVRQKVQLTDEMYVALINEIKKRGSLWNPEDENFNDRFHIMTSWKQIAKTCDLPEPVVKSKWKNLRDLFKREVKKYKPKSIDDYKGRWRHFKALWFIHRPEDYAFNNNDDDDDDDKVSENDNEDNQNINFDDLEAVTEHFIKPEPSDRSEEELVVEEFDPIPGKRRRYNDDDFDMMYLKSLTPYFRQLDSIRKLVVRSKIQDMLMNEIAAQKASSSGLSNKNN